LTNSTEEKFLAGEDGQDLIASGIYRAFKDYKSDVESINR
jgi:N-acetylmuramoyl-L-alanine amidase